VLLISADSDVAVIHYAGAEYVRELSQKIGSRFEPPTRTTVSIALNPTGQFVTTGSINGQPVRFLVDTGANIIAINSTKAATLGIAYSGGREMLAETAGGVVKSWTVALDLVQVGAIRMSNVDAAIIEGEYPQEILLGMTFLKNVEISERGGLMVLTSKF
jgi:aspartyl protease family protein